MWNPFLEKSNLTFQQENSFLRQIIESPLQSSQVHEETQKNYEKLVPIFRKHPSMIINFIFEHLSIEDCFSFLEKNDQKQMDVLIRVLNDLSNNLKEETDRDVIEKFSKQYTKYSSIEKVLVILKLQSSYYVKKTSLEYLTVFIADFVRASALAIESYMKLRTSSPKFEIDYIEHGGKLVKNTQNWVKSYYRTFLGNLPSSFKENDQHIKRSIINGVSDIIGALMQIQRENNIQKQVSQQILQNCFQYCNKVSNINEINNWYLTNLRNNNFYLKFKKILIPQRYTSDLAINQSGYIYLMYKFLNRAKKVDVYSLDKMLNYLIPVCSQICNFEYSIKTQLYTNLEILISQISKNQSIKQTFITLFESNVPFLVFCFNLWHYIQKQFKEENGFSSNKKLYQTIKQHILDNINHEILLNSLTNMARYFHPEELENQVNQFIGVIVKDCQILSTQQINDRCIILIQQMKWTNVNQKGEKLWKQIISSLMKKSSQNNKNYLSAFLQQQKVLFAKEGLSNT